MTPRTLDDLGVPGALYLWTLLQASRYRLALAPTEELAVEVLEVLAQHEVVALKRTATTAEPGFQFTPIEGLAWRWTWSAYTPDNAMLASEDFLESIRSDQLAQGLCLTLWERLVLAEGQAFYGNQLARSHFDVRWQQDMGFAQRFSQAPLNAAQWRYCAWAAVRYGASVVCQRSLPATDVRESMYRELARRASALASGRYGRCALPPSVDAPPSALARGVACQWLDLRGSYWTELPNLEAIRRR